MRAALFLLLASACSSAVAPPHEREHGAATAEARTAMPPPAPLANGALYSVALVAPFDIQRPYAARRDVAIWNDGTIVVLERTDAGDHETERVLVVRDFGRSSHVVLEQTDAQWVAFENDGRYVAVMRDRFAASEIVDVATGRRTKLTSSSDRPAWLHRFDNPLVSLTPTLVGTSRDGSWAIWSYIGALVPHTYVVSKAGIVDLEEIPPKRVAIGDDGVAMFFIEQESSDRQKVFLASTYDLRVAKRGEPFAPFSQLVAARPDVGAYTAAAVGSGFAVGYEDGSIALMDRAMATVSSTFKTSSAVVALAASPDGQRLASIHADGGLYVWPLRR